MGTAIVLLVRHFWPGDFFADLPFEIDRVDAITLSRFPVFSLLTWDFALAVVAGEGVGATLIEGLAGLTAFTLAT